MNHKDLLFEIGCEELPPTYQVSLTNNLAKLITKALQDKKIGHGEVKCYSTPRRIAVLICNLMDSQPEQKSERLGPSTELAFDKQGMPTIACLGFARSAGVCADQLTRKKTDKGERVAVVVQVAGKKTVDLIPELLTQCIKRLPISKPMRWGASETEFIRPVHWIVLLFGRDIINAEILGCKSGRETRGHRFHHPRGLLINEPRDYAPILYSQGNVIVDRHKRKKSIVKQIDKKLKGVYHAIVPNKLLEEVTGLVEWPVILSGNFDQALLSLPREVLITSMQTHQKTFAIENHARELISEFIIISNIESKNPGEVIAGNERVMRARLTDAQFFYNNDCETGLTNFIKPQQQVVFQKSLGTLADKTKRISKLAAHIAKLIEVDIDLTKQAAKLSKCDLLSEMVGEFPSLQGTMGGYYAEHSHEDPAVAHAIKEQYLPRFAGDALPYSLYGAAIAIADKLDTITGIIGINQVPTGDKDPFALRRAALGVLRILIEKQLPLDLMSLLKKAKQGLGDTLSNENVIEQTFEFMQQRLTAYYHDQSVQTEVVAAVNACHITEPYDFDKRIKAVQHFIHLPEASALASANKRVSNILKKQPQTKQRKINNKLFESDTESLLVNALHKTDQATATLYSQANYAASLTELAELKEPIDHFFDNVMIMSDNEAIKNNRLAILQSIQKLFGKVADLSLLN